MGMNRCTDSGGPLLIRILKGGGGGWEGGQRTIMYFQLPLWQRSVLRPTIYGEEHQEGSSVGQKVEILEVLSVLASPPL